MPVQRAGPGRPDAAPAGELEPQREVDVLPVGKEPLVEPAELDERVGSVGCRAATRTDGLGSTVELVDGAVPQHVP